MSHLKKILKNNEKKSSPLGQEVIVPPGAQTSSPVCLELVLCDLATRVQCLMPPLNLQAVVQKAFLLNCVASEVFHPEGIGWKICPAVCCGVVSPSESFSRAL